MLKNASIDTAPVISPEQRQRQNDKAAEDCLAGKLVAIEGQCRRHADHQADRYGTPVRRSRCWPNAVSRTSLAKAVSYHFKGPLGQGKARDRVCVETENHENDDRQVKKAEDARACDTQRVEPGLHPSSGHPEGSGACRRGGHSCGACPSSAIPRSRRPARSNLSDRVTIQSTMNSRIMAKADPSGQLLAIPNCVATTFATMLE